MLPKSRKLIQSLIFFAGDQIYTDIQPDSELNYIRVCDQSAIKLLKDASTTMAIIISAVVLYSCFPLYAFIKHNEIPLFMPMFFPFTDMESTTGITINILNQIFVNTLVLAGNFGIEVATSMTKNSIWSCAIAIGHSVVQLTESVENTRSKRIIDYNFRNILVQVQDFDWLVTKTITGIQALFYSFNYYYRFILESTSVWYWKLFLQPYMLTFGVSLALFFNLYVSRNIDSFEQ